MTGYRYDVAQGEDIAHMLALSRDGMLYQNVLRFRYPSLEQFFLEAATESGLIVCRDGAHRLVAWACCSKFNLRSGYSQTVQFTIDAVEEASRGGTDRELYARCESACSMQGIRSIVAFAHSAMPKAVELYRASGLELCGHVELNAGHRLGVYCKGMTRSEA